MTHGFLSTYFLSMRPSTSRKKHLHGKKWVNMYRWSLVDICRHQNSRNEFLSLSLFQTLSALFCCRTASPQLPELCRSGWRICKHRATLLSVSFVISKSEIPVPSVGLPSSSYLTAHDACAIVGRHLQASEKNVLTASLFNLGWRPVWGVFVRLPQWVLWEDLARGDLEFIYIKKKKLVNHCLDLWLSFSVIFMQSWGFTRLHQTTGISLHTTCTLLSQTVTNKRLNTFYQESSKLDVCATYF